ncbi:MAG: ATP-binding protein, partial [Micrococcales bacterium]|nr:ATP-binding protein [Micrococcales bacterium]
DETGKQVGARADGPRAQPPHYPEAHDIAPPQQLERQADRASEVEDEMRSEFDGLSTRTKGHYRLAVSADTEEEALARARAVVELYKPEIKVVRELDQYRLAREFVPGEPVANTAHTRHLPVLKVAAGVPAVTAEVGDRRGALLGRVSGGTQAVIWDPWFATEQLESSGLVPIVGGLGAGKSFLGGGIVYKTVLTGVPWTVMDPSGLLARLAVLPDLCTLTRVVTLLESAPGSLNPYAQVPEPTEDWAADAADSAQALARARTAAAAQRRDLAYDTLRWCLPYSTGAREDVQTALRDAIHAAPAAVWSSPLDVVTRLEHGDELAAMVARRLREAAERELSRLFFPERAADLVDAATPDRRLVIYSLVGLPEVDERRPVEEWGTNELLTRPILALAAWATLRAALLRPRHERKGILLDEMHEITKVGAGSALVQKISTDNRKRNIAALVLTQNASRVLGQDIGNFVGSAFVGRTTDAAAQADACDLLGLPRDAGYEAAFGSLSSHVRRDTRKGRPREFVFRDGMGGDGGRGGMERITVDFSGHPDLVEALNTTADPARLRQAVRPRIEVA